MSDAVNISDSLKVEILDLIGLVKEKQLLLVDICFRNCRKTMLGDDFFCERRVKIFCLIVYLP